MMKELTRTLLAGLVSAGCWCGAAEIAHYPLRDGKGTEAKEASGKLAPAKIRKSFWMSLDGLNLIDFGGMKNSRQASVVFPEINFTGEFSIATWVRAYWWNANWAPIVYRSDATYGIRNNRTQPGQLHFRVKDANVKRGTNLASNAILERNCWYHVAAVFKPGKFMRLYINGKLDSEMTDRIPKTLASDRKSRFHLGGTGKENNNFAGLLSDVHFYDHALTPDEVLSLYRRENRFDAVVETPSEYPEDGRVACKIAPNASIYESGALKVVSGDSSFRIDSIYSYPASPVMEFNSFAAGPVAGEKSWKPSVKTLDPASAGVTADGSLCSVSRKVTALPDGRIRVADTVTNRSKEDQAMVIFHRLTPEKKPDEWYLYGQENAASAGDGRLMSANPTLYVRTGSDATAMVAEDDIFRCTMTSHLASLQKQRKRFDFGCRIGIPAGKSHTIEFTVYPMRGSYFDFINRLRADWKVPVQTLPGPFGLIRTAAQRSEVYKKFAADKPAFKKEFERRNMRVITLNPWFNYWDGAIFPDRESFKKHMQQAMRTIREVNPDAKFLVSLESYVYCLTDRDFAEPAKPGFSWTEVTPATRERVLNSPWRDSVRPSPDKFSLYPLTPVEGCKSNRLALNVYPERGNQFYKTRLEEFDFLLDEVGFDGVYQDMFGFSSPNYVRFDRWDGFSVSIRPDGTIGRKMCHLGPLTAPARADWLRKIIGKGKIALTNFGAPTTRELQTIPYWNFCEAAGRGIGRQDLDSIPPDASGCAMNQLSTPLGYGPHRQEETDAVRLMARVRAYLRYGCLYIHTSFRNSFPPDGPKSGAYGPINHMYPITPVELQRGWVKGKERIVSCVSYRTNWDRTEKPKALRFDAVGRDKPVGDAVKVSGKPGAWKIEVKIDDWKEFLILE